MIKLANFIFIVLLILTGTAFGQSTWETDLTQAMSKGRRDGRMLMIDFRAEWCTPCKLMEAQVYTPAFLAANAGRIVPVRIDLEKQPEVARRFHVETLPTVIFTDSWGGELIRHAGTLDGSTMALLVTALPNDLGPLNKDQELLSHDRNDTSTLVDLAERLRADGLYSSSTTYYLQALQHGPSRREDALNGLALNSLDLRQTAGASKWLRRCLKEFPKSTRSAAWVAQLSSLNLREAP